MNILPVLLLSLTTLVLRSGDRITIDAPPREENGVVTFRVKGTLYSLPASEIDRVVDETSEAVSPTPRTSTPENPVKLRVSDEDRKRLLAELEKNHTGTPAPEQQRVEPLPPAERAPSEKETEGDEWAWRREARAYEEAIRRAKEELELLETRASELQWKIFQLVALGYKPISFTYESTQLASTLEQIPRARLEVIRAERAYAEFRDEARRRGVLPGWLR